MSQTLTPSMHPSAGERLLRFVGDRARFSIADLHGGPIPPGWRARLRTNLGRAELLGQEIIHAQTRKVPFAGASWHDLPMRPDGNSWVLELPLTEPGYFSSKAYFLDLEGWQHWPDGPDVGISVHPDTIRTANTIYCAFTRMFGPTRKALESDDAARNAEIEPLDDLGYTVIPPSGTFRDLIKQLPHIIDTLGCRVLHLLPIGPTPTVSARFGRFGSPYASLDLTAIDPALVEFDRRTTGQDQFRELAYAVHLRGARLFLDIVINHTGWGSSLQETHPEWFLREPNGAFASPGAWGTTWEDLVELEHRHVQLWECLAESLLTWCRRGVDGFRCDAGYKVPLPAWQYIIARVRQEFPDAIFLLEGLGGAWELTENLLTAGGMQWAYSELFQNHSPVQVSGYLDHSLAKSERVGVLVNYSETHDNDRLAGRGRAWSLMRNGLCALTSVNGGFGFTCGVEWLAPERVNVHSSRGLAWDNPDNIVPELARLNRLLCEHPCFFDGAKLTRLSNHQSPVYALRRDSAEGLDSMLVLVNTDHEHPQKLVLAPDVAAAISGLAKCELLGQPLPGINETAAKSLEFALSPGQCVCLAPAKTPRGLSGENYRRARAQAGWALAALGRVLPIESIPEIAWMDLAKWVNDDPARFLAAASELGARKSATPIETPHSFSPAAFDGSYAPVVTWRMQDLRRIQMAPPRHWLLVQDTAPFRAQLITVPGRMPQHVESIPAGAGHIACFPPGQPPCDARLVLERYDSECQHVRADIRFLDAGPILDHGGTEPLALAQLSRLRERLTAADEVRRDFEALESLEQPIVLLTNGIGGMARMCIDLGASKSKYDCLLGANLHPRVPVDRHIIARRVRVWVNADGFITPLDLRDLVSFKPGPPAVWQFVANAGDGRMVEIHLTAAMLDGRNSTVLLFDRPAGIQAEGKSLPDHCDVRLTVRVDIEDRNFHHQTNYNGGADHHFMSNCHVLEERIGFSFTPAVDRKLRVFSNAGKYHPSAEWSHNLPHWVEQSRGQEGYGDAFSPGWFEIPLERGAKVAITACADEKDPSEAELQQLHQPFETANPLPGQPADPFPTGDVFGRQLLIATKAYMARRDSGVTVIAGYPWFLDWGRDSLICARGLLAAGMHEQVRQLLIVFGKFVRNGTLPNTIHGDDASNRDTSDAPLWYGVVCEELAELTGADLYKARVGFEKHTIATVLEDIAANYVLGTPNGIRMDPDSGLIWSPSHFTWMDTNYPAGTPRQGYPIEIQVLWVRLLRQLGRIGARSDRAKWIELAELARHSIEKLFWIEDRGWMSDLLIASSGQTAASAIQDDALRGNCLFAVSLDLLRGEQARKCVDAALRHLVVPGGLRTLAPLHVATPLPIHCAQGWLLNNPSEPYWGRYEGDEDTRRKPAYHNGTAWVWTYAVFCEALAKAWNCSPDAVAAARAYLGSLDRLLMSGCVGQLPEILDGDAPHTQRGCDAQAWSVTEALRVWKFLGNPEKKKADE